MGARIAKIYDSRKWGEELDEIDIDSATGIFLVNWDPDTSMLFLSSKGSATVTTTTAETRFVFVFVFFLFFLFFCETRVLREDIN